MPDKHSKYSPSASHKWLKCPGSLKLEANLKLPDIIDDDIKKQVFHHFAEESKYADEGNVKHNEAAKLLLEKRGRLSDDDAINEYLEYCRKLVSLNKDNNPKAFVETEVGFEMLAKNGFGTIDFFIIADNKLEIVDFKYGRRRVPAFENPQLMLYAWGVFETFAKECANVNEITLTIVQPRALDLERSVDSWGIDRARLLEFGKMVRGQVKLSKNTITVYNPGEHCTFCRGKINCPSIKSYYIEHQQRMDNETEYTNDELAEIIPMIEPMKRFFQEIENLAIRKLSTGERIPYFTLKNGTSRSYWKDGIENDLIKLLGERAYEKTIIPITKARKYLGSKTDEFTYKRTFGPKLVQTKTRDNEPAVNQVKDMFE